MHIVYASDDCYAPIAGISMLSLFESHLSVQSLDVHIIDHKISPENKRRMESIASQYGRKIRFVPMGDLAMRVGMALNPRRWSIATYARLFECSLLPDLDRVIHLDCDTIVLDSLEPVWDAVEARAVAGVCDCVSAAYKREIGLRPGESYLNCGVLVFNLARMRALNCERALIGFIRDDPGLPLFPDQSALNGAIAESEKATLPLRYNALPLLFHFDYHHFLAARRVTGGYPEDQFRAAREHPAVLHFTTCYMDGARPWIRGCRHPRAEVFERYKALSPWADWPQGADERPRLLRWAHNLCHRLPKSWAAFFSGLAHGILRPRLHVVGRAFSRWEVRCRAASANFARNGDIGSRRRRIAADEYLPPNRPDQNPV